MDNPTYRGGVLTEVIKETLNSRHVHAQAWEYFKQYVLIAITEIYISRY